MRLGAHMSIEGGFSKAVERGRRAGCETMQVFTKNSNRWGAPFPGEAEVAAFASARESAGIEPAFGHSAYLINPASPDDTLFRKSVSALAEEIRRCDRLGLLYLVLHPGSTRGEPEAWGVARVARALKEAVGESGVAGVRVLLETTAGSGHILGHRFQHLRDILDAAGVPGQTGVCFDTAHVFAAGYDIRTAEGYSGVMGSFQETVGVENLYAIHLNDSAKPLGSRVDRHAHIGKGLIGLEAFRCIVNDPRLSHVPAVLETPKSDGGDEDIANLAALRSLAPLTGML